MKNDLSEFLETTMMMIKMMTKRIVGWVARWIDRIFIESKDKFELQEKFENEDEEEEVREEEEE